MKQGYTLADLAMYNLEKMAEMDKQAFEPMPGGQPQGAPMDPAAAGGMPPQGAPMDPMAGGGAPAASLPPPAAAPAAPPAPPPADHDAMINAIRQVMMEMGGGQGGAGGGKGKGGGKDTDERLGAIEAALAQVLQVLNLASPDQAVADAVSANAQQAPKGGDAPAGYGSADPGAGSVPATGPMDPNAGAIMSQMQVPQSTGGVKMGSARPLDNVGRLASAMKKARR